MSYLPRKPPDPVELLVRREAAIGRSAMPPRVRKATELGVAIEQGRAIVQSARVRGLERVAREAMRVTGALAREEAFWMAAAPHAAGRLQAIGDAAALAAADIVTETGQG